MNANLVERPRLALATAIAIVAAVAIVAALFPNTISIAEIPERGNSVEDLWGRTFTAAEATERGQPYEFSEDQLYATFDLQGWVGFGTACGEIDAEYRLYDGRLDWRERPPTYWHECGGQHQVKTRWVEAFLAERPAWRLDGNTLQLSSDFGTMTLVDNGEGSKPSEILGKRFYTEGSGGAEEGEKPRLRSNIWLTLSFDRDGTLRASLGCESVVVPTEVRTGWFRITEALQPKRTLDCSRSMAAQETAWLWALLDQPVQWQVSGSNSLTLKAYQPDPDVLGLGRVLEGEERVTDPDLLAGKTFYAAPKSSVYDNVRPVVIEVDDTGGFTATAGCEQPSIHGRLRTGWVDFGEDLEWSLAACEDSAAEQWLADFLAHEPSWYTVANGELILRGGRRFLSFAEAGDYERTYAEPPPSGPGG